MSTPYQKIYGMFKDRIGNDRKFYIKNDDVNIVNQFANMRMMKLLNQAIYYMYTCDESDKRDFEIDFNNRDDMLEQFNIELKDNECQLIADAMFCKYINEQTIDKLNALRNIGFKDDELVQFSPANTLKEFNATIDLLNNKTINSIKAYKKRDRSSGKYKNFNYDFD